MREDLRDDLKTRLREYVQRVEEQESVLIVMEKDILRNKYGETRKASMEEISEEKLILRPLKVNGKFGFIDKTGGFILMGENF